MASFLEVDGETIDEAIDRGLGALGLSREQAKVEILQDARKGLLGFGTHKARVRVSRRDEQSESALRDELVTAGSRAASAAPLRADDRGTVVLGEILARMEIDARIESVEGEEPGQSLLCISSSDGAILIGRHGQTLEALEYLVNRIVMRQEERGTRILLDVEGYRDRRRRELEESAQRLAAKVRRMRRAESMNPMSPRERRIVHMALAGNDGVVTESVGEGHFRRVVISPSRNPSEGRRSR